MSNRRKFLKTAGVGVAGLAAVGAPAIHAASKTTITWRMQTYAGPALGEHVIKPAIDAFNKIAGSDMQIELYYADQLVPTGELFRAALKGDTALGADRHRQPAVDELLEQAHHDELLLEDAQHRLDRLACVERAGDARPSVDEDVLALGIRGLAQRRRG